MTDKIFTKEELKKNLKEQLANRADRAIEALKKIYSNQTAMEQTSGSASVNNKVGFTGLDAGILTSFINQLEKKGSLTDKQMILVFKLIPKYASQLIELSISEGKIKKIGKGQYTW